MVNVKLLNPGFEYRFFNDAMIDAFLKEYFPEYRSDYLSFRFRIQRYDFFRYLAVYKFGGFYLDLDVFLARDLNPLLMSKCVFPFEELAESIYFSKHLDMDWMIGNYAFGAEPNHPFLAAIIENCLRAKHCPTWSRPMLRGIPRVSRDEYYVLNTTGPGLVTRTFAEDAYIEDIEILFPEDVCNSATWHQFGDYGIHKMDGSWRVHSNVFGRLSKRLWRTRTLRRMLAEGRERGKTRSLQERGLSQPHNTPAVSLVKSTPSA